MNELMTMITTQTNLSNLLGLWINHLQWFTANCWVTASDLSVVPKASGIIDVAFSGLKGDLPPWTAQHNSWDNYWALKGTEIAVQAQLGLFQCAVPLYLVVCLPKNDCFVMFCVSIWVLSIYHIF